MSFVQCIPRFKGEFYRRNLSENAQSVAIDVSDFGEYPYNLLSPFTFSTQFQIPVPGLEKVVAHSVEGIWQGLRLIDGKSNYILFHQIADNKSVDNKERNRRDGKITGYQYGAEVLDEREARWAIFIPSYTYYLNHFAPKDVIDSLLALQEKGKKLLVYDTKNNDDISNPEPYAHAAVLASYLNLKIFNKNHQRRLERVSYD